MDYEKLSNEELIRRIRKLEDENRQLLSLSGKNLEEIFSDNAQLLGLIPGIIYKTDPQGLFTYVSPRIRELGYDPDELLGKHFSLIIHPEDVGRVTRNKVLPNYQGKVTGDEKAPKLFDERRSGKRGTFGLELRIRRKEEEKPQESLLNARVNSFGQYDREVFDREKQFLGSVGLLQVEDSQGLRGELGTLINMIPDIIYKIDPRGNFIYVNDAVRRLGYDPEDLIGRHFTTILEPSVVDRVSRKAVLDRMKGTTTGDELAPKLFDERRTGKRRTTQLEVPIKARIPGAGLLDNPDSEDLIVAEVTASGFYEDNADSRDNRFLGTVGIIRDITERKLAEKKLNLLGAAIEQSNEIVVITDLASRIQYVNPIFEKITGYSRDEAIGSEPSILKSGKHDHSFYQEIWKTIAGGDIWQGNLTNRRRDGSLYLENATIFPVKDSKGNITNYAKVARDVTIEKELELQYYQSQKMEAVGRLAGGIAHDFNNLLTGIIGNVELMRSKMAPGDPLLKFVSEISHISDRSSDLISQLLAFSRKEILTPSRLDINHIISEMERMLSRIIGENILFITELEPTTASIRMNQGRLEQIIVNLTINARDAMPAGGELVIATSMETLTPEQIKKFPGLEPGRYIRLEVRDTGIGLDEETLSRIFEPFFTTKEKGKGTGLGLTTVYGIVKQAGGAIEVNSILNQGTSFRIYLPPDQEDAEECLEYEPSPGGSTSGNETLLVVEDEDTIRNFLKPVFSEAGYNAFFAASARDALGILESITPDLLLTDLVLPDINGRELALQVEKRYPGIKTLYMSGYSEEVIAHYSILEQGLNFIGKPFKLKQILRKVRQVLDNH